MEIVYEIVQWIFIAIGLLLNYYFLVNQFSIRRDRCEISSSIGQMSNLLYTP